MDSQEPQPSPDQLRAMAYVDGEMDPGERPAFERCLAEDSELSREVTQLQRLGILARQMAPPEPKDTEWARLERELVHRAGLGGGFALLVVGVLGLVGSGLWMLVATEHLAQPVKLLLGAVLVGLGLLFATVLRGRLRTLPFDPYTEVQR